MTSEAAGERDNTASGATGLGGAEITPADVDDAVAALGARVPETRPAIDAVAALAIAEEFFRDMRALFAAVDDPHERWEILASANMRLRHDNASARAELLEFGLELDAELLDRAQFQRFRAACAQLGISTREGLRRLTAAKPADDRTVGKAAGRIEPSIAQRGV